MMIGIPVAALIGGVATPAGSSINILGIFFIQEYGDVTVRFLDWMVIGVPMVLAMLPLSVWVLLWWYPPEMEHVTAVGDIHQERDRLGPVSAREWRVLLILATMILLWILSTWFPALNVVLVSLVGAIVMFLPGMQLFTWKEAERAIGWEALLMVGGVTALGAASVETGLAQWLVDSSLGGLEEWSAVWVVALVSAFTVVVHLALPIRSGHQLGPDPTAGPAGPVHGPEPGALRASRRVHRVLCLSPPAGRRAAADLRQGLLPDAGHGRAG